MFCKLAHIGSHDVTSAQKALSVANVVVNMGTWQSDTEGCPCIDMIVPLVTGFHTHSKPIGTQGCTHTHTHAPYFGE